MQKYHIPIAGQGYTSSNTRGIFGSMTEKVYICRKCYPTLILFLNFEGIENLYALKSSSIVNYLCKVTPIIPITTSLDKVRTVMSRNCF